MPPTRPTSWRPSETDRVLDLLEKVKGYQDGTLSFRRSCAHGVCGSDAMRINGCNRLACKTLVRDVGDKITVEPMLGLQVIKDLIVDMEPFFDNYKKVMPWFINDEPAPARQGAPAEPRAARPLRRHHQVHPVRLLHHLLPVLLGQRTSTSARRRSSPRTASSLTAATRPPPSACRSSARRCGVARCHTVFNCTLACPREIQVTQAIGELKRAVMTGKVD